jgi:cytochrome c
MFDTMTSTKILGAVCGALLLFLFAKWGADALYTVGGGHGAHGEEHVAGYLIEVEESAEAEVEEEGPDFATIMASADVASGAKIFKKCSACHKVEKGANATGPYLHGVVGRAIDSAEGFGYSGALEQMVRTGPLKTSTPFLRTRKKRRLEQA